MSGSVSAATALAACVRASFGPSSGDQVIVNEAGGIVITSSCHQVLSALQESVKGNAAASIMCQSAVRFGHRFGDGSARYVLMLAAAVQASHEWISAQPTHVQPGARSGLVRALPTVLAAVQTRCCPAGQVAVPIADTAVFWDTAARVLTTALQGLYRSSVARTLADIAIAWVKSCMRRCATWVSFAAVGGRPPYHEELSIVLRQLAQTFPVVTVDKGLLSTSAVLDDMTVVSSGARCRRSYIPATTATGAIPAARFVAFNCALDFLQASTTTRVAVSSEAEFDAAVSYASLYSTRLVSALRRHRVSVVLCSEKVTDSLAQQDLHLLCDVAGVVALTLMEEAIAESIGGGGSVDFSDNVGEAAQLHISVAGGKELFGFQLVFKPSALARAARLQHSGNYCPQLLLRGPSQAMCSQHSQTLKRCITLLSTWLSAAVRVEQPRSVSCQCVFVSPAGCTQELALARLCVASQQALKFGRSTALLSAPALLVQQDLLRSAAAFAGEGGEAVAAGSIVDVPLPHSRSTLCAALAVLASTFYAAPVALQDCRARLLSARVKSAEIDTTGAGHGGVVLLYQRADSPPHSTSRRVQSYGSNTGLEYLSLSRPRTTAAPCVPPGCSDATSSQECVGAVDPCGLTDALISSVLSTLCHLLRIGDEEPLTSKSLNKTAVVAEPTLK